MNQPIPPRPRRWLRVAAPYLAAGLLALAVVSILGTSGCTRTVYVQTDPPAPQDEVRPTAPDPQAVWISGHWGWNGRRWDWKPGHWAGKPKGKEWVPGHWNHTPRGWRWVDGHWKR